MRSWRMPAAPYCHPAGAKPADLSPDSSYDLSAGSSHVALAKWEASAKAEARPALSGVERGSRALSVGGAFVPGVERPSCPP